MAALIILLIFGLGVSIFALQNTILTTVVFLGYPIESVPLYAVIIGSMLIGVIAASIIGLINSLGSAMTISRKNHQLSSVNNDVNALQKRITELEQENIELRHDKNIITVEKDAEISQVEEEARSNRPTFMENLRRNFK